MSTYPRDLIGYGAKPPHAKWPGGARIAVQIVPNYEEGSEYSIPDGDGISETYLTEVPGASLGPGKRARTDGDGSGSRTWRSRKSARR